MDRKSIPFLGGSKDGQVARVVLVGTRRHVNAGRGVEVYHYHVIDESPYYVFIGTKLRSWPRV